MIARCFSKNFKIKKMKGLNSKNVLLIAVMIMSSLFAVADGKRPVDQSQLEVKSSDETVIVLLNALMTEKTVLTLKGDGGVLLIKEIEDEWNYGLRLNLENLEAGEYELIVNRAEKNFYQTITLTKGREILFSELELELKPTIIIEEDYFLVENPKGLVESVSLIDDDDELVYKKEYKEEANSAKSVRYNLKKAKSGRYYVQVTMASGKSYYEKVIVK